MTILAIDQGTTSTKAFLLHPDGLFETIGARKHAQFHPAEGHVEQDALELVQNIDALIDAGLAACPDVAGIAIANQGETVIAWDRRTKQPLHRAIVWQDQRTQPHLETFGEADRHLVKSLAGLPLDAYFSASKLAWLLKNVPAVAEAARGGWLGLGTSDAYFLDRLTGAFATDATTASRTSLMNLATGAWDDTLCRLFEVPMHLLPPIRPTTGAFGTVRRAGRAIPLVASVVDQQAALFGHGCRAAGDAKVTFGTGSFALVLTGATPVLGREGLSPTLAWKLGESAPVYALEGGDYTAAAAVDWALSLGLGASLDDFNLCAGPSALERDIVFVPALAGLAAPHWDRAASGLFLGLRQDTSAADMRRAVLEGVALRAVELVEALGLAEGAALSVDGGMTRNSGFVAFLADALGRNVVLREHADLTGLGAAELGMIGLGRPLPPREAGCERVITPSPRSAAIRARRPRFAEAIALSRRWGASGNA
jgi:glycerol kinase